MLRVERRPWTDLEHVVKADLIDRQGRSFAKFRESLRPKYGRVALDIGLGYLALAGTGIAVSVAIARVPAWSISFIIVGGISFGYWMAYLLLFVHEGAHFNLASNRKRNDRIANAFIAVWIGAHIANYRAIHWDHHRLHGDPGDTEHTYFAALDLRFIAETLFMVRALRVILFRRGHLKKNEGSAQKQRKRTSQSGRGMLLAGISLHAAIVGALMLSGEWPVAVTWVVGIGMFLPFFAALRQLLEHRSSAASAAVDYTSESHGRTTRMFREGIFGSTFGSAGFTRHLLHHWEPSLSYTRLAEVEEFLADCEPTRDISRSKVTYVQAFRELCGR